MAQTDLARTYRAIERISIREGQLPVRIEIPDSALVEMDREQLGYLQAAIRRISEEAFAHGLAVQQYRNHERMCEVISIGLAREAV